MPGKGPIYYIGDVHGRADLLRQVLIFIEARAARLGHSPVIHFLGDIVDRGPESCAAMELVHKTLVKHEGSILHLGNHDQWFLQAIESNGKFRDVESWVVHGGWNTMQSYTPVTKPELAFEYIRTVYPHHIEMLRNASRFSQNGPLFAVHAGIDPRTDLEAQKRGEFVREDPFLWVRDQFLLNVDKDMMPVIHGHTIVGKLPVVTENRISIDTGAYHSGRLTVCVVDAEMSELTFYQTDPDGLDVVEVEPVRLERGYGSIYDRLADLSMDDGATADVQDQADVAVHPAVATFLRDRGGEKARPTEEDHTLGHRQMPRRRKGFIRESA